MRYKLIEVSKKTTGQELQSIYDYDDLNQALYAMDNSFGVDVKDSTVISVYCFVLDRLNGTKVDGCYFEEKDFISEGEDQVTTVIRNRVITINNYSEDNMSPYDTERLALGNYHTKKASSKNRTDCNWAITILVNGKGDYKKFSRWVRGSSNAEEIEEIEGSDEEVDEG